MCHIGNHTVCPIQNTREQMTEVLVRLNQEAKDEERRMSEVNILLIRFALLQHS